MSRTILDPQYANDLNGLFDGTSDITASTITVADGITIEAGSLFALCYVVKMKDGTVSNPSPISIISNLS